MLWHYLALTLCTGHTSHQPFQTVADLLVPANRKLSGLGDWPSVFNANVYMSYFLAMTADFYD